MREDKKQLPIGLIPNGSGNDTCRNLMRLFSLTEALDFIVKGDVIKSDVFEVLLDFNTKEEVMEHIATNPTANKLDFFRYGLINSGVALLANCARNAISMKAKIGRHAYTVQTVIELFKGRAETFDIDIDNGTTVFKDM